MDYAASAFMLKGILEEWMKQYEQTAAAGDL